MHTRRGGDSTAGSFPNGKRLAKLCATATGGIHPPLGKRISAPQVNVCSTAGRCPNSWAGIAGTSAGATGGILKSTPTAEVIAPQVIVYVAPQVDVPINGRYIAGTSAGATGGKLKFTPAVEAIAPQVDVSTAGKHRPARTEDRR